MHGDVTRFLRPTDGFQWNLEMISIESHENLWKQRTWRLWFSNIFDLHKMRNFQNVIYFLIERLTSKFACGILLHMFLWCCLCAQTFQSEYGIQRWLLVKQKKWKFCDITRTRIRLSAEHKLDLLQKLMLGLDLELELKPVFEFQLDLGLKLTLGLERVSSSSSSSGAKNTLRKLKPALELETKWNLNLSLSLCLRELELTLELELKLELE